MIRFSKGNRFVKKIIHMTNLKKNNLLKTALISNAVFSLASGTAAILMNNYLAELFLIPSSYFILLGIGLILFGGYVMFIASRETISLRRAKGITIADLLWVVGSVALLLMDFGWPSLAKWIVGIIALIVADFTFFQNLGAKRLASDA